MLEQKLLQSFDSYPDFPQKGILFRDVLPVLKDPELFKELISSMSNIPFILHSDVIVAIDARGFIFGTAIAFNLEKPCIFARKPGKLPGDIISNSYELEYGTNTLCLQRKSIDKYNKFSIVDDLLATGGTAASVEKTLISQGKDVTGLAVVVELSSLSGKNKLNCPVLSQLAFE